VPVGLELVDELSIPSVERVMDELQQDVRRAVTAVPQIFSDPTPARDTRGLRDVTLALLEPGRPSFRGRAG